MLHSREPTTGIMEYKFDIKGLPVTFVDTGGERSERRKWIYNFDQTTCVLFFCASSAFDQTLWEDPNSNRLSESLNVLVLLLINLGSDQHQSFCVLIRLIYLQRKSR